MKLFDDRIDRSNLEPAAYAEAEFAYLNRSGRPEATRIRNLLEEWFARFPEEFKAELKTRFRLNDREHHLSAFFELYLHELLITLGYKLEVYPHSKEARRKPDFLAFREDAGSFYLEAAVATNHSKIEAAEESRLRQAYDALNRLDSPNFFLSVETYGTAATPIPGKKLRAAAEAFLKTLDPDECTRAYATGGMNALPVERFVHGNFFLELRPIPKKPEARGKPGNRSVGMLGPGEARWDDERKALRDSITKKAGYYGDLSTAYIVAVNTTDQLLDEDDIMEALVGKEVYTIRELDPPVMEMSRKLDGAWTSPSGPVNTRVSAVLVVSCLIPWSVRAYTPEIYHNPWAKNPCRAALTELANEKCEKWRNAERSGLNGC